MTELHTPKTPVMNPSIPPQYSRKDIADVIVARFDANTIEAARNQFKRPQKTQWFAVDNLLPEEMAHVIRASFPEPSQMFERKSLRERKHVTSQMDQHHPQGEEALFAFQDDRVVDIVQRITELPTLHADPKLYAGGLSLMTRGNFLNPHLDNSHNSDQSEYRVLNLLYYASPNWSERSGGHLELWPDGIKAAPLTLHSLFNRFVVMTTGPDSWHSVCAVTSDQPRCCVSNYYFSPQPIGGISYSRVTSFRGRPEQPLRDLLLRVDAKLRGGIRKLFPAGIFKSQHIFERRDGSASK
jgi:Rps23 Pro-64 3,4-dihydroxylase Tpa1-like proline 4-hydroxylase